MSPTDPVHDQQEDGQHTHTHAHDHHHHHHHHHAPHVPTDGHQPTGKEAYETANKQYFDAAAHAYDNIPDAQRRAETIGGAMQNTGLFKKGVTTVMDFACGTGLISRVLAAEDPKSIVGVDISQAMVDQYNKTVSDHGIPPEEMNAVCVAPNENLRDRFGSAFDVIVCASAYHHFISIDEVTQSLVACLKPGGSLLVADLVHGASTHEAFPDDVHHIVPHKGGFSKEDIQSTFEKAGLKNFTFDIIANVKQDGHPVELFLARGDNLQ